MSRKDLFNLCITYKKVKIMKKLVLLFACVFCFYNANTFAEQKVGSYNVLDRSLDVEASINDKGQLNVYVGILGEYTHTNIMLGIKGEDNIKSFAYSLREMKAKYNEWKGVARANGVTDYSKEMDIPFPNVEIYWKGSSKWYSTFSRNFIKMMFLVSDDGSASVGCGGEAEDWDNEYITEQWYFLFTSADEIEGLIKVLDVEKIKNKLSSKQNTDDLFN